MVGDQLLGPAGFKPGCAVLEGDFAYGCEFLLRFKGAGDVPARRCSRACDSLRDSGGGEGQPAESGALEVVDAAIQTSPPRKPCPW